MRKSLKRNDGFNPKNQLLKVFSKPNSPSNCTLIVVLPHVLVSALFLLLLRLSGGQIFWILDLLSTPQIPLAQKKYAKLVLQQRWANFFAKNRTHAKKLVLN